MFNLDDYLIIAVNYIHSNPLSFGILWGLFKLMAIRSENTIDDKITTMISNWFKGRGE